jgi:CheY-like chemotaxis protein
MPRGTRFTVLLIEPDTSLRRLIALGLQQLGVQVVGVSSLNTLADQPIADPDLLVLDIDNGWRDDASLLTIVQTHPYLSALPMVVLAWEPLLPTSSSTSWPLLECLAKPFDARQLHATIENLLETSVAISLPANQLAAGVPVASSASAASLCPLVTAAGLLLTVIGLMLQLVVAGLGLLVVLIALLWWTLGKRPERQILLGEVGQKYSPSLP